MKETKLFKRNLLLNYLKTEIYIHNRDSDVTLILYITLGDDTIYTHILSDLSSNYTVIVVRSVNAEIVDIEFNNTELEKTNNTVLLELAYKANSIIKRRV